MGVAVDTASTAREALAHLEAEPPDLAILDVDMPEGTGLAVCEMITHSAALKNVTVVILTGKKDPNTIQRCHELRAFYVTKCADVWPRIRPLLEDLLELSSVDDPPAGSDVDATSSGGGDKSSSAVVEMMDAVFEALAYDGDYLAGTGEEALEQPPERPWVLCIDDDASFSFALQLRLQEHGVDVLRAFAGREGYRTAFHSRAQAIILDYELPEGNGDYVLRRLKENPVTQDIPVIVLTGTRDRHLERKMYSLGAASFMNKPYDWNSLWRELKKFLTFGDAKHSEPFCTANQMESSHAAG
jgi:DNA-binding response OmpR family regulator